MRSALASTRKYAIWKSLLYIDIDLRKIMNDNERRINNRRYNIKVNENPSNINENQLKHNENQEHIKEKKGNL